MPGRDFYAILGVGRDVSDDELKKAYKKQAMKHHPDRHSGKGEAERKAAEEKFKDCAEAFETLSDPNKRAAYDAYGEEGLKAGGSGAGAMPTGAGGFGGGGGSAGGFPGGATYAFSTGGGGGGMDAARAQQLFEQFFSGGGMGGGLGGLNGGLGGGVPGKRPGGRKGGGMSGMSGMSSMGGMGGPQLFDMGEDDPFGGFLGGGFGGGFGGGIGGGMRSGRQGTPAHGASARVDLLAVGTLVRLEGLHSVAHNGATGCIEAHDSAKQRYVVRLDHDGSSLSVRHANCVQVVTEARISGTSHDELNGRTASCATYDRASKRYKCEGLKADGTILSLKPENVVLPRATRVTIDGVSSRPGLNGCVGEVRSVDEAAQRYDVQLPTEAVRVRFGAVAAC